MNSSHISLQEKVISDYIHRNNVSKSQEVAIRLYLVLVRTYIEYCLQLTGYNTQEGLKEAIMKFLSFFTYKCIHRYCLFKYQTYFLFASASGRLAGWVQILVNMSFHDRVFLFPLKRFRRLFLNKKCLPSNSEL